LLGMGAFDRHAPWTLLHELPVFSSQHVPTRFLFPAVLMLMLVFAAFAGGYFDTLVASRGWVDLLLLVPVYAVAVDITSVGRKSTENSFYMEAPPIQPNPVFHHQTASPYGYSPEVVQGASLLAMFANVGVIGSYGLPALEPGAIAMGAPGYRGEAYVVGAQGGAAARITKWTPNTAVVEYDHAAPGALLVYNMNYDPGWRANGRPALDYQHAVAIPIAAGTGRVKFSYYPPALNWGLAVCAATFCLAFGVGRQNHRVRGRRRSARNLGPPFGPPAREPWPSEP
jgi:hypothetical protein